MSWGAALSGAGCGSPVTTMVSPPRSLCEALGCAASICTLPCSSRSCARERLISSCAARNRSMRWPADSAGTSKLRGSGIWSPCQRRASAFTQQERCRQHENDRRELRAVHRAMEKRATAFPVAPDFSDVDDDSGTHQGDAGEVAWPAAGRQKDKKQNGQSKEGDGGVCLHGMDGDADGRAAPAHRQGTGIDDCP